MIENYKIQCLCSLVGFDSEDWQPNEDILQGWYQTNEQIKLMKLQLIRIDQLG